MGEEQMTRDAGMAVREGETAREQAQAQTPEPTPVRVQMPEQTAVPGQMAGQTQANAAKQEQEVRIMGRTCCWSRLTLSGIRRNSCRT